MTQTGLQYVIPLINMHKTFSAEYKMSTKAVCLVGNEHLAGVGYLLFGTQHSFDDEVLHLPHQHWEREKMEKNNEWMDGVIIGCFFDYKPVLLEFDRQKLSGVVCATTNMNVITLIWTFKYDMHGH